MDNNKILDSLNEVVDSLDKSIPFLEGKIKEFRSISELVDSSEKQEIGHIYNDLANMLGVMGFDLVCCHDSRICNCLRNEKVTEYFNSKCKSRSNLNNNFINH